MADDEPLSLTFHYNGIFVPNPLVYFDPDKVTVQDVDFRGMNFGEFKSFVLSLIKDQSMVRATDFYFCLPDASLSEGLHALQNECDFNELVEAADGNNRQINVYVDHHGEPIFDWIQMEEPPEEDEEDEVESTVVHCSKIDHEEDEQVVSTKRTVNDHFLNKLCPIEHDEPAGEQDNQSEGPVYPTHVSKAEWKKMAPVIGMKFSSPSELKLCLSNYAVANGYALWFEKNDKNRLLVRCCKDKTPTCPFRLWSSWMTDERTFQIKSLHLEHNCSRAFKLGAIVTYKWIGRMVVNDILANPKLSVRKLKALVSARYNINVIVGQCKNAKKFALCEIEGTLREHYAKLWDYGGEILRANPGSHVQLCLEPQPDSTVIFDKFYVSFKAVVDGWLEGCRKVIGLDGCFLKGMCKGELLSAVGRDANNQIYSLAWAVVNVENKSTWKWFVDNLMEDIGGGNGSGIAIMSDGHKGLIEAVKERIPEAEHRLCGRHILTNFHKRFKGEHFVNPFWDAVRATTQPSFKVAMEEIKRIDTRAFDYLMERDPKCWSLAFFKEGFNCDAVENSVSESWNGAIVDARRKPIIAMLEDIRVIVMERLYTQKKLGESWNLTICPAIRKKIEDMKIMQRFWQVYTSGYQQFEVVNGNTRYAVDLSKRECGCRSWQLRGYPCVHGIAAIASLNLDAEAYVAGCFSTESFLKSYAYNIHPLNDSSLWPHNDDLHIPLPPKKKEDCLVDPQSKGRETKLKRNSVGRKDKLCIDGLLFVCNPFGFGLLF